MRQFDLALFVCEQKSFRSLQDTESSALKTRRVFAAANSLTASFHADHSHLSVFQKGMEQADSVAPAANASDKQIREWLVVLDNLTTRFDSDDELKISDHHRVRMRAERRTQYIMSGPHIRDPIAHRFVDRFLERGLTSSDRHDFRAEEFHARDVERLPLHVDLAHVDHAFAAESCCHRGGGNSVLARTGFGDDALFAHSPSEQNLAKGVVDFVCPGVKQVFPL